MSLFVVLFCVASLSKVYGNKSLKALANGLEESPLVKSYSAEGLEAILPCDITPPLVGDTPQLVVFSYGSEPIYSVDARNGAFTNAVHWASDIMINRNPRYEAIEKPYGLRFSPAEVTDEGDYHCRVDFTSSPTRLLRVKLFVAVKPKAIVLEDEDGREINGRTKLLALKSSLVVTCRVIGGRPLSSIIWSYNGASTPETIRNHKSATNVIRIPNFHREDLGARLTCMAKNTNLTEPKSQSVIISLKLPPNEVKILNKTQTMIAGRKYELSCRVSDSRPAPTISWLKAGNEILQKHQKALNESTVHSIATFRVSRNDNQAVVQCRAWNKLLPENVMEDSTRLTVLYPPIAKLVLGQGLNLSNIEEGEDIYFQCQVDASPEVQRISWLLNDKELKHNLNEGVIFTTDNLVVQKIRRTYSGKYQCQARNKLGFAKSNVETLTVKYMPECSIQEKTYGVAKFEKMNLSCKAHGNPTPIYFTWAFNESSNLIEQSHITKTGPGYSIIGYEVKNASDFGTIMCWGHNSVAKQQRPCVIQVVPASVPEPVQNCTVFQNSSADYVIVTCSPGWNGGSDQIFTLEVTSSPDTPSIGRLVNEELPVFVVADLPAGAKIYLSVQAENSIGISDAEKLTYFIPIDIAEERLSATTTHHINAGTKIKSHAIIALILGGVLVFFAVFLVILTLNKVKKSKTKQPFHLGLQSDKSEDHSHLNDMEQTTPETFLFYQENNPNSEEVLWEKHPKIPESVNYEHQLVNYGSHSNAHVNPLFPSSSYDRNVPNMFRQELQKGSCIAQVLKSGPDTYSTDSDCDSGEKKLSKEYIATSVHYSSSKNDPADRESFV